MIGGCPKLEYVRAMREIVSEYCARPPLVLRPLSLSSNTDIANTTSINANPGSNLRFFNNPRTVGVRMKVDG